MPSTPGSRRRAWAPRWAVAIGLAGCARSGPPPADKQTETAPATTLRSSEPPAAPNPEPAPASKPAAAERKPGIVFVAGGDVNFGRECGQAILQDPGYDPFRFVAPLWDDADFRFVNLESQLSDQKGETQSPRNRLIFTGPPGGGKVLAHAGIHVVSTANNHAWDYGKKAFFETLSHLKEAGVKNVGTGDTLHRAQSPVLLEANGIKVAVFATTHIWNYGPIKDHAGRHHVAWAKFADFEHRIRQARRTADFVILSYHGGEEYQDAPLGGTRRFFKAVMKAGVDAVIGHHPHVPQGVGWFGDRPAFYSLGNFVFAGHPEPIWTNYGMLARLELGKDRSLRAKACPYFIDGHTPKPLDASSAESVRYRRHLEHTSLHVGGSAVGEPDAEGCFELAPPTSPRPTPTDPLRADRGSGSLDHR